MAVKPLKTSKIARRALGSIYSFFGGSRNEFYPGGQSDQRRLPRAALARDIAQLMTEQRQRMLIGDGRYIYQADAAMAGMVGSSGGESSEDNNK